MGETVEIDKNEWERILKENRRMGNALKVMGIDPSSVIKNEKYDQPVYLGEIK